MKRQLVSAQTRNAHTELCSQLPRNGNSPNARSPEWMDRHATADTRPRTCPREQRPDTSTHPPGGQQSVCQPPPPTDRQTAWTRNADSGHPKLVPSPLDRVLGGAHQLLKHKNK